MTDLNKEKDNKEKDNKEVIDELVRLIEDENEEERLNQIYFTPSNNPWAYLV